MSHCLFRHTCQGPGIGKPLQTFTIRSSGMAPAGVRQKLEPLQRYVSLAPDRVRADCVVIRLARASMDIVLVDACRRVRRMALLNSLR